MGTRQIKRHVRALMPALLLVGALGCDRIPSHPADPRESEARRPVLSATGTAATGTARSSGAPGKVSLDEFEQALLHSIDRSRWRGSGGPRVLNEKPASPTGPVVQQPEGQGVHATILVKNPDGTVRSECISSAAEVSALVEEIRKGQTP